MAENGFKETDIGVIPEDWNVVNLSDNSVADLIMGQSPSSSTYNQDGVGLPFMQGKAEFGRIYPNPDKWCSSPSRVAEQNDVLMSVRAPVGDVNMAPFKCAIGRGLAAIRAKQKSKSLYLFFYLHFAKKRLEDEGTGSTFKAINKGVLENFKLALPEIDEQKNIIAVLSKLQQAIAQQEKIIEKTKELKRSLMHRLFTYGLRGEELKETEIGLMPKSWEPMSISDISDKLIGGGTPSTKIPQYWKGNIEWTTSKRLGENIYLYDGEKKISENGLNNSSTNLIPKDNLLISTRVTVGKAVVNKADIAISQDLTGMIINKDRYSSEFIVYQFKIGRIQKIFEEQKRGATIKGITREDLKKIKLGIPDIKEQKEITNILSNVDKKIQQAETRMQGFQSLFKSMLQLLMTGQVRVKDIDFGDYL